MFRIALFRGLGHVWVWAIFALVAVGIWLMIVGTYRLTASFEYTNRSRFGLGVCALFAVATGLYVGFKLLGWPAPFNWLAAAVSAPVFFVFYANAMAELWVRRLLRQFDVKMESLLEKQYAARNQIESARDRIHSESIRLQGKRERDREIVERVSQLEDQVGSWQQGGGVARVRTLRVEEWRGTFANLDEQRLASMRDQIKREIASIVSKGDDEAVERVRQLQAELAVLDIEVINRHRPQEEPAAVGSIMADQEQVKRSIDDAERDLAILRQHRAEFLKHRIRLE